jgi:hypothetical protein
MDMAPLGTFTKGKHLNSSAHAGPLSYGRAHALQSGPVHVRLAARRAAEGLPAPETELAAEQVVVG